MGWGLTSYDVHEEKAMLLMGCQLLLCTCCSRACVPLLSTPTAKLLPPKPPLLPPLLLDTMAVARAAKPNKRLHSAMTIAAMRHRLVCDFAAELFAAATMKKPSGSSDCLAPGCKSPSLVPTSNGCI